MVLQRCGQDLLKAIEYFANDNNISTNNFNSAFRPLPGSSNSDYQSLFPLSSSIYSNLSRNLYNDSYCLLNIIPDQLPRSIVSPGELSAYTGLTIQGTKVPSTHEQDNNVAFNLQYNHYFNSSVQQQLRDGNRSGFLHLPPIIPCVQPNCTQCYKFL